MAGRLGSGAVVLGAALMLLAAYPSVRGQEPRLTPKAATEHPSLANLDDGKYVGLRAYWASR